MSIHLSRFPLFPDFCSGDAATIARNPPKNLRPSLSYQRHSHMLLPSRSICLCVRGLRTHGPPLIRFQRPTHSILPILPRQPFVTRASLHNKQPVSSPRHKYKETTHKETEESVPELPAFNLGSLGLSKNMKIFLVVILSIFGSMETYFYCRAAWRWWKGSGDEQVIEES